MSWLDYAPAAIAALACLTTALGCFARIRRSERRCAELRADVAAFSEASMRVADTLDTLLKGEVEPREAHQPSRRYVLGEAQRGIADGESLEQVASRLHLSHDEARLLAFAAMSEGRRRARARNTRTWAA